MPLDNDITVYPAHGAGSACGKNMSKETFDTLGHQKEVNYALQDMTKEAFIEEVTSGLLPPPFYFPENVAMNKKGVSSLEQVVQNSLKPLSVEAFTVLMEDESVLMLDVRGPQLFCKGFIPGSIFIGLKGDFAPWVGTLITDMKQRIALVTEPGQEEEAITRLARVGYDGVVGYLEGGFEAWDKSGNEIDQIESISAEVFAELASDKKVNTIDVRKPTEFQAEHLEIGISAPLHELNSHMSAFKTGENNYIHCAGGYRSMIAASILKSRGIHNVIDIAGGYNAISKTSLPKTNFVCPSTL
jgi:rhodanese-related sulfurtransferase